jgi:hypothetical protein
MPLLTRRDIGTLRDTIYRTQDYRRDGVETLKDIFSDNARLIISPSNQCIGGCTHCVANSTPRGKAMPYSDFKNVDSRFFELFKAADFGRRGDPMGYSSEREDIVSLMGILHSYRVDEFTVAAPIYPAVPSVVKRLGDFVEDRETDVEMMVTYHHYFEDLDLDELAGNLNESLKDYVGFSKKILISLLGDDFPSEGETMKQEVKRTFFGSWANIFSGMNVRREGGNKYSLSYGGQEAELSIPQISGTVYPLGRFRDHLSSRGILEEYEKWFDGKMGDYVCPDLVKWPGIVLEPNGDLNLCASFEAINCRRGIVTNIFEKSYGEVGQDILDFHKKEADWFVNNLEGITSGNISTCRLKWM